MDVHEKTIIQTDSGLKDGQNKCPKCGGTDISLNIDSGRLRCNSCRHETEPQKFMDEVSDLATLDRTLVGSGAADIVPSAEEVLTFKCSSCAAEVVVDTSDSLQARCHWCRNTLSVNQQIPNGAVPDMVLPFGIKKDAAQTAISGFVGKRRFFAHPQFKKEFTAENVMGVYLPYMVVDINAAAAFSGQGEIQIRQYMRNKTNYYDADLYDVSRAFDLIVENLAIESNVEKLRYKSGTRTNNIVNAVRPFDSENCLRWNANFLRGFTSQKRDADVDDLSGLLEQKVRDIARFQARQTAAQYNRGIRWDKERLEMKGSQWQAAYLPIWLYSYKHKDVIHYVAVNGRSAKVMGSVPINIPRLWLVSAFVQLVGTVLGIIAMLFMLALDFEDVSFAALLLLLAGPLYFGLMYMRYRNKNARFHHESAANASINNLERSDKIVRRIKGTQQSSVHGRNESRVEYKGGK